MEEKRKQTRMKKQQSETGAVGWLAIYSTFRFVHFHNLNEKVFESGATGWWNESANELEDGFVTRRKRKLSTQFP